LIPPAFAFSPYRNACLSSHHTPFFQLLSPLFLCLPTPFRKRRFLSYAFRIIARSRCSLFPPPLPTSPKVSFPPHKLGTFIGYNFSDTRTISVELVYLSAWLSVGDLPTQETVKSNSFLNTSLDMAHVPFDQEATTRDSKIHPPIDIMLLISVFFFSHLFSFLFYLLLCHHL